MTTREGATPNLFSTVTLPFNFRWESEVVRHFHRGPGRRSARGLRHWRRELVLPRPTIIAAPIETNAITARTPPTIPSA